MAETSESKLYYVYDPMCSWCWGYRPTLNGLEQLLTEHNISFQKVLGGLAPDTDEPMPPGLRETIEATWRTIEAKLGTHFNYDFWRVNVPRRSTYPACRAILLARKFDLENEMNFAIQRAYYEQAKNPSDLKTLSDLASQIGMPQNFLETHINDELVQKALARELRFARSIGGNSFPSWILVHKGQAHTLSLDYSDPEVTLASYQSRVG